MIDPTPLLAWLAENSLKAWAVALIVLVLQWLIGGRLPARWRHALWLLVVIRLLMPVAPQSNLSLYNLLPRESTPLSHPRIVAPAELTADAGVLVAGPAADSPAGYSFLQWLMLATAGVWAAIALLILARHIVGSVQIHRRLATSAPLGHYPHLATALDRARRQAGIRKHVDLIVTDVVSSPALHGLLRPAILIPREVAQSFDADELHHVILHELSHLRRGDAWTNALLAFATSLHWFNPLIWFAAARIREERELVCDELALSCLEEDERGRYGRTLLRLLERFRAPASVPALVGIADPGKYMKRRIQMIASYRSSRSMPYLFAALVAGVAAVGFTDAKAGERVHVRKMMLGDHAQMEKLHQRATFSLQNATLSELVAAVSNSTGAVITIGPEAAQSKAASARFDVEAVNAPSFLVLVESLQEFDLAPVPSEDGSIQIASAPDHHLIRARVEADRERDENVTIHVAPSGHGEKGTRERVVIRNAGHPAAASSDADVTFIRRREVHADATARSVDGSTRKTFNFTFDDDGVKTDGSLRIEVRQ